MRACCLEKLVGRLRIAIKKSLTATKGKKQLQFSDGLRKLLGLDSQKSDEELAAEQNEHAFLMSHLSKPEWYRLRRLYSQYKYRQRYTKHIRLSLQWFEIGAKSRHSLKFYNS